MKPEIVVGIRLQVSSLLAANCLPVPPHSADQQIVGKLNRRFRTRPLLEYLIRSSTGNTDFQKLVICLINNIHLLFALKGQKF